MRTKETSPRIRRNGNPRSVKYNGYTIDYNKHENDEFTVSIKDNEMLFDSMKEAKEFIDKLTAPKTMTKEENEMWVKKLAKFFGHKYKFIFDADNSGLTFIYKDGKLIHRVPNEDINGETPLYKYWK